MFGVGTWSEAKVFHRYKQHPEAFPVFFSEVFVMRFMRLPQRREVRVFTPRKKSQSLVNDDFMHEKIGDAVKRGTDPDVKPVVAPAHHPEHDEQPAGNGEDQEKGIVALQRMRRAGMVILVNFPQQSMHKVFMGQPGHRFHGAEAGDDG